MPLFHHNKYLKIELIFFIVYFYVFRFLTDFEYNFWQEHKTGISGFSVEYNLLFGTMNLIAYWLFYQIIKKYLNDRRVIKLVVLIVLFLVFYSVYLKCCYYLFSHLDFLSEEMRKTTSRNFDFKSIGYSLAYVLREFLSISFLAYFIHVDQQTEKMKVLKEQQLIAELTYLKVQLQPHFFFNTLNNIYGLALSESKETAPLVAKLAELMRYILYHSDHKLVSLRDEVNFIENYVEVERVRYRKAIRIDFEKQSIDGNTKISPLLLLPFIENAFKHGVQEEEEEGFVHVLILRTEDELMMEVRNSIAHPRSETGGIGLANVKKRLEILYPNRYVLDLQDDGSVFSVNLTLNIA